MKYSSDIIIFDTFYLVFGNSPNRLWLVYFDEIVWC